MTITSQDLKISESTLENVFSFTQEEAEYFVSLSDDDKIRLDFSRIASGNDFASKIAKTVIENDFEKLSAKQADIINQKSIFFYDPIFTSFDHKQMEERASTAKYRQASSSLR